METTTSVSTSIRIEFFSTVLWLSLAMARPPYAAAGAIAPGVSRGSVSRISPRVVRQRL